MKSAKETGTSIAAAIAIWFCILAGPVATAALILAIAWATHSGGPR